MRPLKKTFGRTLVALGFGLIAGWAQAEVILLGIPDGAPGQVIELSIAMTEGSSFTSIDIIPMYETFDEVITLVDFKLAPVLGEAIGGCDAGACVFFFLEKKTFPLETVLATFHFRVTDDAESYVDTTGNRGYRFDLGVLIDATEHPLLPVDQIFTVLPVPVPEPSTWSVIAAGILLLIASWYRRSLHGSRATPRCADPGL